MTSLGFSHEFSSPVDYIASEADTCRRAEHGLPQLPPHLSLLSLRRPVYPAHTGLSLRCLKSVLRSKLDCAPHLKPSFVDMIM